MKFLIFSLILIITINVFTDNLNSFSELDSLKMQSSVEAERDKIKLLERLFEEYLYISLDSAFYWCQEKLFASQRIDDSSCVANSFINISIVMNLKGEKEKAIEYVNKANEYYISTKDSLHIAYCFNLLGVYYYNFSQFKKAKNMMKFSLEIYKKLNLLEGIINVYYALSSLHFTLADYNKALEYCLNAFCLLSDYKDRKLLAQCQLQASIIYLALNNRLKAQEMQSKALKLFTEISDNFLIGVSLLTVSKYWRNESQIDSSRIYSTKALNIFKEMNYRLGIALSLVDLGNIEYDFGRLNKAWNYYCDALEIAKNLKHFWIESEVTNRLGEYCLKKSCIKEAYIYFQKSLDLAKKIGSKDLVKNNYLSLSHYYQQTGNYIKALEFHQKYTDLKDSLFLNIQNDITDLQVSYHIEREQREKELLQKNNEIYKLEIEKQKLYKSRLFLLFIIVTLISVFIYFLYRQKKRLNQLLQQKVNEAFAKHCEQQQIISHQAGLTSLGELAAGIAHEINQPVQNIILCVENIEMENVENSIQNKEIHKNVLEIYGLIDRIRYILEHIRLFSSRQREEYCETFNINKSINDAYNMVRKQFSKHGIKVKLELKENLPLVIGNSFKYEQVVLNLLLNSRDALSEKDQLVNSEYQKEIILKSYPKGKHVYMEVWDNGVGIPEEHKSKIFLPFHTTKKFGEGQGLGLSISYGIIKEMGGQIDIDCLRTGWTLATIMVPVYDKMELLQAS